MISSILAFVATTELMGEHTRIILTTIVGSTTIIVGFLQAMNGLCSYGTRGVMHEAVAIDLRDMRNNLRMLRNKLGFEEGSNLKTISNPPEEGKEFEQDTFEAIQNKFEQSLSGCKSIVPLELSEAFDGTYSTSGTLFFSIKNAKHNENVYGAGFPISVFSIRLTDILVKEISGYPLFPLILPDGHKRVEKTFKFFERKTKIMLTFMKINSNDYAVLSFGRMKIKLSKGIRRFSLIL